MSTSEAAISQLRAYITMNMLDKQLRSLKSRELEQMGNQIEGHDVGRQCKSK